MREALICDRKGITISIADAPSGGDAWKEGRPPMKKNILMRTNLLDCLIIIVGFLLTAVLS